MRHYVVVYEVHVLMNSLTLSDDLLVVVVEHNWAIVVVVVDSNNKLFDYLDNCLKGTVLKITMLRMNYADRFKFK